MNYEVIVRPAREGDLAAIVDLENRVGLPKWSHAGYLQQLDSSVGLLLVAEAVVGGLAGFANARIVADEMELLAVAVDGQFRRRGHGLKLLSAIEQAGAEAGALKSFLEVRASNSAAIRLYQKRGYVESGSRRSYYRDPVEDAVIMVRLLGVGTRYAEGANQGDKPRT